MELKVEAIVIKPQKSTICYVDPRFIDFLMIERK